MSKQTRRARAGGASHFMQLHASQSKHQLLGDERLSLDFFFSLSLASAAALTMFSPKVSATSVWCDRTVMHLAFFSALPMALDSAPPTKKENPELGRSACLSSVERKKGTRDRDV